jgi:hypothetical protein
MAGRRVRCFLCFLSAHLAFDVLPPPSSSSSPIRVDVNAAKPRLLTLGDFWARDFSLHDNENARGKTPFKGD